MSIAGVPPEAESRSKFGQPWLIWAKRWRMLAESDEAPGKLRPILAESGQMCADVDQNLASVDRVGQRWGQLGQRRLKTSQTRKRLVEHCQVLVDSAQHSPKFGQHRPLLAEVGPTLGFRRNSSTTVGQRLVKFGVVVELAGIAAGNFRGRLANNFSATFGCRCHTRPPKAAATTIRELRKSRQSHDFRISWHV